MVRQKKSWVDSGSGTIVSAPREGDGTVIGIQRPP